VGDIQQIPTWNGNSGGHVTDLFYCEYTNDYFPEIYYGRFSAQNAAQLQPQLDKTLQYEQYTMPDPSYLNEVVMVAGMDGSFGASHGNGQINYGTINYFNEAHGITSHTYLYPESGNNAANIRQDISNGVTFANYTAHCGPSGWSDPEFNTGHVPALQNQDMYGLLIGNCCSSSEFQEDECFAEAIVRAENKGAVGYIGGSNSTMWDPDYYFGVGVGTIAENPPPYEETTLGVYDGVFHTHGEAFSDWYTTQDQIIFAGNLAVTLGIPSQAEYYWEIYHLMGDPSLMIYLSEPPPLTVAHDPLIPLGSTSFTITTEPYAYAAVSIDGICYGAALADAQGDIQMSLESILTPGNADVVVTKQNAQPFIGTVLVMNPEGPFVALHDYIVDDSQGNGNGQIDNGESILLDVELMNWGNSDAQNVSATLSMDDKYCENIDDHQEWGTILAQDSSMQPQAYNILVDDSIPDQHMVLCDLNIEDATREVWNSSFTLVFNAPVLAIGQLSVDDSGSGNGNGRLDPGETADLILTVFNNGHADAYDADLIANSSDPNITLNNALVEFDVLEYSSSYDAIFNITVSENAVIGSSIEMEFDLMAGPYVANVNTILRVGLVVEDFETGNFTAFNWQFSGTQPWQTTTQNVFEGTYSSVSGNISDDQNSELLLDVHVLANDTLSFYKKVSCEDDTYGTDYDFLAFFIDGIEVGRWDGEIDWSLEKYPISIGVQTLKWEFSKDGSVSNGEDCAWVDYIVFPAMSEVVSVQENIKMKPGTLGVYPNPAHENLTLVFELAQQQAVSVQMMNILGQSMMNPVENVIMDAGSQEVRMDVSNLNSGVYFCVVSIGDQRLTKKIIISK